jgi:hypothetical protein
MPTPTPLAHNYNPPEQPSSGAQSSSGCASTNCEAATAGHGRVHAAVSELAHGAIEWPDGHCLPSDHRSIANPPTSSLSQSQTDVRNNEDKGSGVDFDAFMMDE